MVNITKDLLRIGSRESQLALTQTGLAVAYLKKYYPDLKFEIVKIKTAGDKSANTDIGAFSTKGIFVKEIEQALLCGEIDMAVHSVKDMPPIIPDNLNITAVLKRADPRDVLVSDNHIKFSEMASTMKVGTSSPRRAVQLKALRNDIDIVSIRGNITTRIKKMGTMELDGVILAAAGIERLGLTHMITEYFDVEVMTPAPGQGVIALETCVDNEMNEYIKRVSDINTEYAVEAERAFMQALGVDGGCKSPLGAYAKIKENVLFLTGMIEKNGNIKRSIIARDVNFAKEAGIELANELGGLL